MKGLNISPYKPNTPLDKIVWLKNRDWNTAILISSLTTCQNWKDERDTRGRDYP
jgi:hypothetical protein